MTTDKTYIAIDLKSFYASVECTQHGYDPLTTHLVVADESRTQKTICLAVSPSLKAYGISGRARLFEVIQKVREINDQRLKKAPHHTFVGESFDVNELKQNPALALTFVTARPRMAHYIDISAQIYELYLKYIAPEDIHVYSIDEVFMDVTAYLNTYKMSAYELAQVLLREIRQKTGITATAGIGTNLYLCKVAMDIVAKHITPNEEGCCIAQLDEQTYRRYLWDHRPLTDFWRVGRGYTKKLEAHGLYTMGDIARCSIGKQNEIHNEDLLYDLFGVNAELLIDHAWGHEPCTMAEIKAYKPQSNSLGSGQVLQDPYTFEKARTVIEEMADQLALDLVEKNLLSDQFVLTVGYDIENLTDPQRSIHVHGSITTDHYGRKIPKHAHGTTRLPRLTSSTGQICKAVLALYDQIVDPNLLIRRLSLTAAHVLDEEAARNKVNTQQLDLFTDYEQAAKEQTAFDEQLKRDKQVQQTLLTIKKKYGKNAVLKGVSLKEGATAKARNKQIGGHRA